MMGKETLDLKEFMDRVQGDEDLLFELFDIFINDFQEKRQLLGEAIEKNDHQTVEHVAHFLKGSCGNISANSLRVIFFDLEVMGQENNLEGAEGYLADIDQKFEELVVCIGEARAKL